MKYLFTIVIDILILFTSCSKKIESPEKQLLKELKEKIIDVHQVSNIYMIRKSDMLCEHLDCTKKKLSIDGYEFMIAGLDDMFMYGVSDYFVLESWTDKPQMRWMERNK